MKDLYVQLSSNACVAEFPSNEANSFKNRLPYPLEFREPGWKVGLSGVSLPLSTHTPRTTRRMNLTNPFLFRFSWYADWDPTGLWVSPRNVEIKESDLTLPPRNGTELTNEIRRLYLGSFGDQAEVDDTYEVDKSSSIMQDTRYKNKGTDQVVEIKDTDPKYEYNVLPKLTYVVMHRADHGECFMDNSRTSLTLHSAVIGSVTDKNRVWPKITIGLELALKMKWIKMGYRSYVLGPNLRKEFVNHDIPTAHDVIESQDQLFFKTDADALYLSVYINWVFTNLDRSFEEAFGSHTHTVVPKRSLYVYSSVGQSVIMGNQITDLLREIPYNPEEHYFEPKHIQYIPVRSDVLDILETQVAENTGALTDFTSGVTTVTLHFKHE